MSIPRFHITTLVPHTITRARGGQAYESLQPHLQGDKMIEVDLSGEYPLAMSFLDELIRRLSDAGQLSHVIFLVKESEPLRKLARIVDIRHVDMHYIDLNTLEKKRVEPLPAAATEVIAHAIKPSHGAEANRWQLEPTTLPPVTIQIQAIPWLQTSINTAAGEQFADITKYFGPPPSSERLRIEKGQVKTKDSTE